MKILTAMKKLTDYKQYDENPFFYAGITYREGSVTLSGHGWNDMMELSDMELRAFLMVVRFMRDVHYVDYNRKLISWYHQDMLADHYSISISKAREITVSLLEKKFIARCTIKREYFFVNPKYLVDLIDECDHPSYIQTKDGLKKLNVKDQEIPVFLDETILKGE